MLFARRGRAYLIARPITGVVIRLTNRTTCLRSRVSFMRT